VRFAPIRNFEESFHSVVDNGLNAAEERVRPAETVSLGAGVGGGKSPLGTIALAL
jgi:hypothetical protein